MQPQHQPVFITSDGVKDTDVKVKAKDKDTDMLIKDKTKAKDIQCKPEGLCSHFV